MELLAKSKTCHLTVGPLQNLSIKNRGARTPSLQGGVKSGVTSQTILASSYRQVYLSRRLRRQRDLPRDH